MTHTRIHALVLVGVLAACCTTSRAQTFYKWTDERGVIHFADEPPPNNRGVEQRDLPAPPAAPADDTAEAKAAPDDKAEKKESGASGPPHVILVSHQVIHSGPHNAHVIGEVKNVGGADAQDVEVTLRSMDASQGTVCLNDSTTVHPATLPPGERGNFDADIDSPCLSGNTPVDVSPIWR